MSAATAQTAMVMPVPPVARLTAGGASVIDVRRVRHFERLDGGQAVNGAVGAGRGRAERRLAALV